MPRKKISSDALRQLLTRSGNRCAFPGCTHPVINEKGMLVAEVCHIQAAEEGGPRYNPSLSDDQRKSYENLIILCPRHHHEMDRDVQTYTVEHLRRLKHGHESQYAENPFKVDESLLYKIEAEMGAYWGEVSRTHTSAHVLEDLKMEINPEASYSELNDEVEALLTTLEENAERLRDSESTLLEETRQFLSSLGYDLAPFDAVPYEKNPLLLRNWDMYHIGFPNIVNRIRLRLRQMHIRHLEHYLKTHPGDLSARYRLNSLKTQFMDDAQTANYID